MIRTIAIVLDDNDFGNTFVPLLEGLECVFIHRGYDSVSEQDCEFIIRQSVMAYYIGFQYRFDLNKDLTSIQRYLAGVKILFNEAAEHDIETNDHDGGAWYLQLPFGLVNSY